MAATKLSCRGGPTRHHNNTQLITEVGPVAASRSTVGMLIPRHTATRTPDRGVVIQNHQHVRGHHSGAGFAVNALQSGTESRISSLIVPLKSAPKPLSLLTFAVIPPSLPPTPGPMKRARGGPPIVASVRSNRSEITAYISERVGEAQGRRLQQINRSVGFTGILSDTLWRKRAPSHTFQSAGRGIGH
jgi:hypothetical protein